MKSVKFFLLTNNYDVDFDKLIRVFNNNQIKFKCVHFHIAKFKIYNFELNLIVTVFTSQYS